MDGGLAQHLATDVVGRVASVSGSQMVVLVSDRGRFDSSDPASGLHAGQIVRIPVAKQWVFGLVTALTEPTASSSGGEGQVFAELDLLGEAPRGDGEREGFARGVSLVPAVGAPVSIAGTDDIATVYANAGRATVRIGSVHHDDAIAATVAPDDLLGKHFAIVGGTGTGKSCATALILQRILAQNPNAHIVLLDPHCEYAPAFAGMAEIVDSTTLELPYWLFSLEELAAVILRTDKPLRDTPAEVNILSTLIVSAKRSYQAQAAGQEKRRPITVDTPVPYRLTDVQKMLEEEMGRLDKPESLTPFLRLKSRLQAVREDGRYSFMFTGIALRDNLGAVLSRLFRVPVDGKPITIVDLSGMPSDVLSVIVSVLGRITFEFALFSAQSIPILLVCEEAHRYLPEQAGAGFEPAKRNLAQIAKEGRKYGVSLCLVSQRPADLAAGALSQCSTVFAMRLTSQADQDFVRGALPDWSAGLMDLLPSLRNGEAVAVGEGVSVPMRLVFDTLPPDRRPHGATAKFSERWQNDDVTPDFIASVVNRWRDAR
ncbi:MAG: ATP-binding protein [Alphaproteobacteria bacterium]